MTDRSTLCELQSEPCYLPGDWVIDNDDGLRLVCDKHLSWMLHDDGSYNIVYTVEDNR